MTEKARSGIPWAHDLALHLGILVALAGLVLLYCVGCVSSTPDRGVAGRTIEPAITETLSALAVRPTATPAPSPGDTATSSPPAQTAAGTDELEFIPTHPLTYVVQSGDTLGRIATWSGTSIDQLVQANAITDVNLIEVGQVLTLPQGAEMAAVTPVAAATAVSTATPLPAPVTADWSSKSAVQVGIIADAMLTIASLLRDPSYGDPAWEAMIAAQVIKVQDAEAALRGIVPPEEWREAYAMLLSSEGDALRGVEHILLGAQQLDPDLVKQGLDYVKSASAKMNLYLLMIEAMTP